VLLQALHVHLVPLEQIDTLLEHHVPAILGILMSELLFARLVPTIVSHAQVLLYALIVRPPPFELYRLMAPALAIQDTMIMELVQFVFSAVHSVLLVVLFLNALVVTPLSLEFGIQ